MERGELALFEVNGALAQILTTSTPSQRVWTDRILSGDLGFPLSKWDVQNALGALGD
jgi:hypothetical protein